VSLLRKGAINPSRGRYIPCEIVVDSYSEENQNTYTSIEVVHPSNIFENSAVGQSFRTPAGTQYKLCKAKFYLKRYGSPVGNLVARLYNITGTHGSSARPTGTHLAESRLVAMENIPTGFTLIEFTFSGVQEYLMETNRVYCIECVVKDATVIDGANCINIGFDNTSPTHAGNYSCCLLYTSPSPRDRTRSRMPSSA